MKAIALLAAFLVLNVCAFGAEPRPYLGQWSNGRGDTLTIRAKTIQFADNKPVPYRDVTNAESEDADERTFELEITARGEVNAFPGKILAITCNGESLSMIGYLSHEDLVAGRDPQMIVHWERDSDD